jgi:CBS domain-containing protein
MYLTVRAQGVEKMPRVRDYMVSSVATIKSRTSVVDAAQRLIQEEKGPLPIMEGDRPVGMVTDRDIIAQVVAEGRDPKSVTVEDVAMRELVSVSPEQDVDEARQLMAKHELERIPVVEGDRLVGMISETDVRTEEGHLKKNDR